MDQKCTCTPYDHCRGRPKFKAKACQCVKCKQKRLDEEEAQRVAQLEQRGAQLRTADDGGVTDGRTGVDGLRGPVGVSYFGNESLNFFFTFLLEIMGILVFFAIATLMFWVSVCYYAIKMAIAVKEADRNVQLVTAGIIGLILLAFAVNFASNRNCKTCSHKVKKQPATLPSTWKKKGKSCSADAAATSHGKQTKKSLTVKCKKCKTPAQPKKCPRKCPNKLSKPSCASKKMPCPLSAIKQLNQRTYTDCEGRQIFQNSRRYAIPTEMKQPPTLVIYVRDWLSRLLNRGS